MQGGILSLWRDIFHLLGTFYPREGTFTPVRDIYSCPVTFYPGKEILPLGVRGTYIPAGGHFSL
jgi:hypothetical protein